VHLVGFTIEMVNVIDGLIAERRLYVSMPCLANLFITPLSLQLT